MCNSITKKFKSIPISTHQHSVHKKNLDVEKGISYFTPQKKIIHIETPIDTSTFEVSDAFYHNFGFYHILILQIKDKNRNDRIRNNSKKFILKGDFNIDDISPNYDTPSLDNIEILHVITYNSDIPYTPKTFPFTPEEAGGGVIVVGP
ncbi:hypothetical protein CXF68_17065 [Tenacibaculum sp. Bg11-29]|uniref:hypothetical protein n=1 Tax=Tenacibaculum sp. Bg11-29 TaxID=2058306 RepID=UPI000C321E91|nr:hypothetical protein [Tenacibaculum sp. Bg11-29]PKH52299.1 hypothetical protein CXF68_17065 [Tenacibaculum sp. Bg11-29]